MQSGSRQTINPIIVEVKPKRASNATPIAPSTPPMAKAVRFPNNTSDLVTGVSRPLTRDEAWALYHFENHALQCSSCANPLTVFRRKDNLCDYGFDLAKEVAKHVYHYNGQYYSTQHQEDNTAVSVEILPEYDHVRSLLKALDKQASASSRPPVVHYDTYPVVGPTSKSDRRKSYSGSKERPQIIIEPSRTSSGKKSTHRSSYTATVVVDENPVRSSSTSKSTTQSSSKERRGTLYEKDMQRREKNYRVEIREPQDRRDFKPTGYYL